MLFQKLSYSLFVKVHCQCLDPVSNTGFQLSSFKMPAMQAISLNAEMSSNHLVLDQGYRAAG